MNKSIFLIFLLAFSLFACESEAPKGSTEEVSTEKPVASAPVEGKGGRMYGGSLKIAHSASVKTLYPHKVTDLTSSNLALQVYEGLVRIDPRNMEILPGIAESWEINEDGTEYTFHLKKGVLFHDDPCFPGGKGREVTAEDFKYSFQLLCTQKPENLAFSFSLQERVKGADAYYEASANGTPEGDIEGLQVIDDHTLKLILAKPSNSFMYILAQSATVVIPKEGVEKYGVELSVGSGPYTVGQDQDYSSGNFTLLKNRAYHAVDTLGNQLPFLDSLVVMEYTLKDKRFRSSAKTVWIL